MEAPEYLDLDEIDFSDDISVSITAHSQHFQDILLSTSRATLCDSSYIRSSSKYIYELKTET
jgi:hypothetical protein